MPSESEASVEPSPAAEPPEVDPPPLHGHFARGALESAAHILGSTSASVFAAGLVLPYLAAASGPKTMDGQALFVISALALGFSMLVGLGAVTLRGLAHCAPHKLSTRANRGGAR